MVASIEAEIWDRALDPAWSEMDPRVVEAILHMQFKRDEIDHMNDLSARAQEGTLTPRQQEELEAYNRVGHLLALLQAQARRAQQYRQAGGK